MFFFLVLLMSMAGLVLWAMLLGIAWRMMLALESLVYAQREVVVTMRNQMAAAAAPAPDREREAETERGNAAAETQESSAAGVGNRPGVD